MSNHNLSSQKQKNQYNSNRGEGMMRKIAKSATIAVQVAFLGFRKSYRLGETMDSILGYTDSLTQVPNRKAFQRDMKKVDNRYSLIMIDIDNFKSINDTNGHLYGDKVLQQLAEILQKAVDSDGKVYRIGGDEFVLIVRRFKVRSICDTIRNDVRREGSFTISQGVVLTLRRGFTDDYIRQADLAMYESKANGKDRVTVSIPAVV